MALVVVYTVSLNVGLIMPAHAATEIIFPVLGGGRYSNDFNASRPSGRHNATDIMAPRHTPLVSPVDGTVYYIMNTEPTWGYSLGIRDNDGYEYNFLHLNNDNEGTDDDRGGAIKAYASDMKTGNKVAKGQHIGWVGDSGHSNNIPHLHFEMYDPAGNILNPYYALRAAPVINNVNRIYPTQPGETLPYGSGYSTSVSMAAGNFDLDPESEYLTGSGRGSDSLVRIFQQNNVYNEYGFLAYDPSFRGGVMVAAGDVDGDGTDEIITGTGPNSSTYVQVFEPNGQRISVFPAYDGYYTGVNVAAIDVDGDGNDEIVTGTGPNSSSYVQVFEHTGQRLNVFEAFPGTHQGTDVAAGDVDGDGNEEIVTSLGPGGSSAVKVANRFGQQEQGFFAYGGFHGGVRVDVGNVETSDVKEEILTAPYSRGGPDIRLFNQVGNLLDNVSLYEPWWSGGYDVAAGIGHSKVGTGDNRRTSYRTGVVD